MHWVIMGSQQAVANETTAPGRPETLRETLNDGRGVWYIERQPPRPASPQERSRPTHGHFGAIWGKGGCPSFLATHAHTHPRANEGLHENSERSYRSPSSMTPPGVRAQGGNKEDRTIPTEHSPLL